jgi:hypothetical protein
VTIINGHWGEGRCYCDITAFPQTFQRKNVLYFITSASVRLLEEMICNSERMFPRFNKTVEEWELQAIVFWRGSQLTLAIHGYHRKNSEGRYQGSRRIGMGTWRLVVPDGRNTSDTRSGNFIFGERFLVINGWKLRESQGLSGNSHGAKPLSLLGTTPRSHKL